MGTKNENRTGLAHSLFTAYFMAFLLFISIVSAQRGLLDPQQRLVSGLNSLCVSLISILPIIAILLFVLAAVAYGVGHIFGAEMRSRATSWATTMVVGAVISLLIMVLARPVLGVFVPEIETSNFCTS
jgi:hypothetical protein